MRSDLIELANQFRLEGLATGVEEIRSGHINDSYRVFTESTSTPRYFLQRINEKIFHDIPGLMRNIELVTRYLQKELRDNHTMQVLRCIPTRHNDLFYQNPEVGSWRMFQFIEGSRSYDQLENRTLAIEAGKAFGWFLRMTSGMDPGRLTVTIPRFHDIQYRLEQYDEACRNDPVSRLSKIPDLRDFVSQRRAKMESFWGMTSQELPCRITHNDTKCNNILFDDHGKAICIVDLDTVMPGSALFDYGDAVRTGANRVGEDTLNLSLVDLDLSLFEAYTTGYLLEAKSVLTPSECQNLAESARYMTFIIGVRFLTDYLKGDIYFKTTYPEHNLQRARVQLTLLERMERRSNEMEIIVKRAAH